jgi:hypothetical protein
MRHPDPGAHRLAGLLTEAAELAPAELGSDMQEVRRRGRRRVRLRRAGTAVAGAAVAVAVAAGAASAVGALPGTSGSSTVAAPGAAPSAGPSESLPRTEPPKPGGATSEPATSEPATSAPVGRLIKTETSYEGGKLTLWFSRATQQDNQLQLSLGTRDAKGGLQSFGSAFDMDGGDLAPGFRQGYNANGTQPRAYALFGYVVGKDVSRVTVVVDGKTRTAKVAPWSENAEVHAWWLLGPTLERWPSKSDALTGEVTALTAYRADGTVVARGAGDIAHG